jgi:glutathione S-transferase
VDVKLYSIAFSHPGRAAGLMLRHKGIEHDIVNLLPGSQRVVLRFSRFRGGTVPALKLDGRRVQGSLDISKALEEVQPEPPLFPRDPALRAAVEEAERWGEASYQPIPRRLFRWALRDDGELRKYVGRESGAPAPAIGSRLMYPVAVYFARLSRATDSNTRADLAALPAHLDHVDELIAGGVIGGEALNAADFQIGTTTRVLLNFPQLRPLIEGRPAGEHAMRVIPRFGGEIPISLPADWVPALA